MLYYANNLQIEKLLMCLKVFFLVSYKNLISHCEKFKAVQLNPDPCQENAEKKIRSCMP